MTKEEILAFITKNVVYTKTNKLYIWSDWWPYNPENKSVLEQISRENDFTIEFSPEKDKNFYRIRLKL
jgi:hypothetical protein